MAIVEPQRIRVRRVVGNRLPQGPILSELGAVQGRFPGSGITTRSGARVLQVRM